MMIESPRSEKEWVVGLTGASGATYAVRLVTRLLDQGVRVRLVVTEAGWRVLKEELDWDVSRRGQALETQFGPAGDRWTWHPIGDIGAGIASGTYRASGMVVVPCSMGTLAGIAQGLSDNLLRRAADVMLKEKRPLIVVPRETPLNEIHLDNMLRLARMGAVILPAMPGFYHRPASLDELVDFLVGKIMDAMGIEHDLFQRWGERHG